MKKKIFKKKSYFQGGKTNCYISGMNSVRLIYTFCVSNNDKLTYD